MDDPPFSPTSYMVTAGIKALYAGLERTPCLKVLPEELVSDIWHEMYSAGRPTISAEEYWLEQRFPTK